MKSKTKKNLMQQRSAHLIDFESLCCESNPTIEHVRLAKTTYFETVKLGNQVSQRAVFFGLTGRRLSLERCHNRELFTGLTSSWLEPNAMSVRRCNLE